MRSFELDLSPLFRSTIGFDRIGQLLESARRRDDQDVSYPPYNIERTGDDAYRIVMAIAGFGEDDLDVTVREDTLTASAKIGGGVRGSGPVSAEGGRSAAGVGIPAGDASSLALSSPSGPTPMACM